jgi:hypothetical protein
LKEDTMNHDHDDGLVHSHGWACRERGAMVHRPPATQLRPMTPEDSYDDGLVHSHNYACGDRGRIAHG